ncbi:1712_t:CDS:2, partial [Dentiscutata heterogama]
VKICENLDLAIKTKIHSDVDMEKDFEQLLDENLNIQRTKEAKTYIKYLALLEQKCSYDNYNCTGEFVVKKKAKLNLTSKDHWFVGCTQWRLKSKGSHFFYYLNDEIDPLLLKRLFEGEAVFHKQTNSSFKEGNIVKMNCKVKFYKLIPSNLQDTPYVILVCQDNLIKATFGKDYLSEVHASLNNINKLRRLIAKIQKLKHPYGQGLLDLTYNIWSGNQELSGYIQQL